MAEAAVRQIRMVKYCNAEKEELSRYMKLSWIGLKAAIRNAVVQGVSNGITKLFNSSSIFLVLSIGGFLAMDHKSSVTVGDLIAFQLYWSLVNSSINRVLHNIPLMSMSMAVINTEIGWNYGKIFLILSMVWVSP